MFLRRGQATTNCPWKTLRRYFCGATVSSLRCFSTRLLLLTEPTSRPPKQGRGCVGLGTPPPHTHTHGCSRGFAAGWFPSVAVLRGVCGFRQVGGGGGRRQRFHTPAEVAPEGGSGKPFSRDHSRWRLPGRQDGGAGSFPAPADTTSIAPVWETAGAFPGRLGVSHSRS